MEELQWLQFRNIPQKKVLNGFLKFMQELTHKQAKRNIFLKEGLKAKKVLL
jgi:hypothetical protein